MKALPSSFKRIAVHKNKACSFSQHVSLYSLVLRYVSVHFAVLWCSCQIFPLNESFNALLDNYRTRKESRSQLLRDLWRHQTHQSANLVRSITTQLSRMWVCFSQKIQMYLCQEVYTVKCLGSPIPASCCPSRAQLFITKVVR